MSDARDAEPEGEDGERWRPRDLVVGLVALLVAAVSVPETAHRVYLYLATDRRQCHRVACFEVATHQVEAPGRRQEVNVFRYCAAHGSSVFADLVGNFLCGCFAAPLSLLFVLVFASEAARSAARGGRGPPS
ncbi:MAG: hypothetical protein M9894_22305 [Planctomycetes bacterium]|nr:hypothetical protein [Planctomycetota bacterium]